MSLRLTLLAVLLLQQTIGLEEYTHLRMYQYHRDRFARFHNEDLVEKVTEYMELEERYARLLQTLDLSQPGDPRAAVRREMLQKAEEVARELERIEKEWKKMKDRIKKIP